jgi:hypothetical protein
MFTLPGERPLPCSQKEVATIFSNLVVRALREAVTNDNALPLTASRMLVKETDSASLAVHRVLASLSSMMRRNDILTSKHNIVPFCHVLLVGTPPPFLQFPERIFQVEEKPCLGNR